MKQVLLIILLLPFFGIVAQYSISGYVYNSENIPISYASVVVLNSQDSSTEAFGLTNFEGFYKISIKDTSNFLIQYSHLGFSTIVKELSANWRRKKAVLESVEMKKSEIALKPVEIISERIPMKIKGDTLIFDALAFKTKPDASVEELLDKLPGIQINRNGDVIVHGKRVKKLLLDGKEYFGNNVQVVIKNLDAETIKEIEVLDKKSEDSEFTGVDDGDELKVLNLVLKEKFKGNAFGKINGAVGTGKSYLTKFNYNIFDDTTQASIIGSGNNVNEKSFTKNEFSEFQGSGLSSNQYNSNFVNGLSSNQGVNESFSSGLNINHVVNDKLEVNGHYFYMQNQNTLDKETSTENFSLSEEFETEESVKNESAIQNHSINFKLKWDIDTLTELTYWSNLFFSNNNQQNRSQTFYQGIRESDSLTSSQLNGKSDSWSTYSILKLRKSLKKDKRNLILSSNYFYSDSDQDLFVFNNIFQSVINQDQTSFSEDERFRFNLEYTEPLPKKWVASSSLAFSKENNSIDKFFFDKGQMSSVINDSLTGSFFRSQENSKATLRLKRGDRKKFIDFGVSGELITLENSQGSDKYSFLYPYARVKFSLKKSETIDIVYQTNSSIPSLNQLLTIPNNRNPDRNYIGNSTLRPQYTHKIKLDYYKYNIARNMSIFGGGKFVKIMDRITNQTIVNDDFTTLIIPQNTSRYELFYGYSSISQELKKLKLEYSLTISASRSRYDAFLNDLLSLVGSEDYSIKASVGRSKLSIMDLKVGVNYSLTSRRYFSNSSFNQLFKNYSWYGVGDFEFSKSLSLQIKYELQTFSNVSFSSATKIHLVNMTLRNSFNEGRWSIFLIAHDIFNENVGIVRSGGVNFLQDQRFNTISQYFMLGINYKLRKKKSNE